MHIEFDGEGKSNYTRAVLSEREPKSLRTFTPSQAVISKSAGVFHWTPEGRRLYDFSSGVLVANLGHNPRRWLQRFCTYLNWDASLFDEPGEEYFPAIGLTAYNAMTELEAAATQRLCSALQNTPGGKNLEQVMWAASGSEAVQKALWACLDRDPQRNMIIATRYGFHGKKGLAGAVTGSENDHERDPRVKFISFPMLECDDLVAPSAEFNPATYQRELDRLWSDLGERIGCLITEPYLGGGGSYHPPQGYFQILQRWCRQHDVLLILDEVQSNFGRTGTMFAFEKYGIEPDFVCLGKGLGNGVPVSAAVGRRDVMNHMHYGEASDTWSANPMSCAAVLATLDEFESSDVLENTARLNTVFDEKLLALKESPAIARVRGEGLVYGIESAAIGDSSAAEVANEIVLECYLGELDGDGIHLLGALAGKVLRVSPPMTMTLDQAVEALNLLSRIVDRTAEKLQAMTSAADSTNLEMMS